MRVLKATAFLVIPLVSMLQGARAGATAPHVVGVAEMVAAIDNRNDDEASQRAAIQSPLSRGVHFQGDHPAGAMQISAIT